MSTKKKTIKIKPSHKGLFTAKAHAAGYHDVQQYAEHILSTNKSGVKHDPTLVKEAAFARNFSK